MLNRYINFVLTHNKLICLGLIGVLFLLASGVTNVKITGDLRAFFSEDNPQLIALEEFERAFSQQDILQFLVVADDGDIFKPSSLKLVNKLTEKAWQLPYSQRVDSLANYTHTIAINDELNSAFLMDQDFDFSIQSIKSIRTILNNEQDTKDRYVSPEDNAALVMVTLIIPKEDLLATNKVMQKARDIKNALVDDFPNHEISLSGAVAVNAAFGEAIERDITQYVGLSYLIILAVLFIMVRTLTATIITLLIIGLSVIVAFGVIGWLGVVITPSVGLVPTMIMTIAVADVIHILASYYHHLSRGLAKNDAIAQSMRDNAVPVFLTTLTTVVGFLSLNFHESPPSRILGNLVVIGILAAYVCSMVLLPALLAWFDPGKRQGKLALQRPLNWLAEKVINHRKLLSMTITVFVIVMAFSAPRNDLVEDWNNQFDNTFTIKHSIDALEETIGGAHYPVYLLSSGEENGVTDPEYLNEVQALAEWFRSQPEVTSVDDVAQVIRRINKTMHNDEESMRRIPNDKSLNAQYILLYSLSLPFGAGLDNLINFDTSATKMLVSTKKLDSTELIELDQRARDWLLANTSRIKPTEATGMDMIVSHAQQRNIKSTIETSIIALVIVSGILVIIFRSLKLGIVSLIPNLSPAIVTYGLWYVFVGEINLAGALVMTMSLGIVVDDTIHFLTKYQQARKEGKSAEEAVRKTLNSVGVAIVMTSLVLIAGFAITVGSGFQPTAYAGALMAMTLTFAVLIDLILLPSMLIQFDKWLYPKKALKLD